ncbi:MAG: FmdE family protein, partial [Desulfobacterales bacterium]
NMRENMNAQQILNREDFKKCLEFHGHLCPGLSIGYRAARAGLKRLDQQRSEDEELVAIVETDACSADAVQVLTGCTFGKGNLIFKDYGKMVFTIASRNTGRGVRISLQPEAFSPEGEHMELLEKVMAGTADESERKRFLKLHRQRSEQILEMDEEKLFSVNSADINLPQKAKIDRSLICQKCNEPAMAQKTTKTDGMVLCRDCSGR